MPPTLSTGYASGIRLATILLFTTKTLDVSKIPCIPVAPDTKNHSSSFCQADLAFFERPLYPSPDRPYLCPYERVRVQQQLVAHLRDPPFSFLFRRWQQRGNNWILSNEPAEAATFRGAVNRVYKKKLRDGVV